MLRGDLTKEEEETQVGVVNATERLVSVNRALRLTSWCQISSFGSGDEIGEHERKEFVELDSHADTFCAGSNSVLLEGTGEKVTVQPFSQESNSLDDIPIGTVAIAYDNPDNGKVTILIVHEASFFGDRDTEL